MSNTRFPRQFPYCSYTEKNGYAWEKRIKGRLMWVSLKTKDEGVASVRSNALTARYLTVKHLSFIAIRETLKMYRDLLVDSVVMEGLTFSKGIILPQTQNFAENRTPFLALDNSTAQIREVETSVAFPVVTHLLNDALDEWCKEMKSEWRPRTEKLNRISIGMFIEWAKERNVTTIEAVNKQLISEFKVYLETRFGAPRTRQNMLVKIQTMFNFCINKRDWITTSPLKGMLYNKVVTVNEKTEVTPDEYNEVMQSDYVQNFKGINKVDIPALKYLMMILWNTGIRIGEAIQLRPEDFRETDGIKSISINEENGKTVKCPSSIRDIPINSHLNELYEAMQALPKGKNIFGWNKNNAAAGRVSRAFELLGYKHSTHDFRYSLSNRLRDIEVADSVRYAILGHASSVMTDRVYKTRQPLKQMLIALEKAGSSLTIKNGDEEIESILDGMGM